VQNKSPFFSVVISTKNRAKLVCKAIKSVLKQTFDDFEVIIIDNASTDNTQSRIELIDDERIFYYKNEIDRERCFARNRGISLSKGKYVCFLDSDDEYLPAHLETLYNAILNTEKKVSLFFTNAYETYNFENIQDRICPDLEKYNAFGYILKYTFNPARVAVERTILTQFQFDEQIPGLEDLDLWLRIASKYPIQQIKERTILYQIHDESYSISAPDRFERELKMFHYVFSKPELKELLPEKSKKRLLSMCHYKLSLTINNRFSPFRIHYHILKAFFLCPQGYNNKANKTMLVIFLDQIPVFGYLFKKIRLLKSMV
jgi:glycosyltransferase involved in cell wall biosynthesis